MNSKRSKIEKIQETLLKINSSIRLQKNKNLKEARVKELSLLLESELERAETILAVKEVNKKLQDMAEDLARMEAEDIMPIIDSIKTNFSTEVAERFNSVATEQLQAALTALRNAKDSINTEGLKLEGKISDEDVEKPSNDMSEYSAEEEPSEPAEPFDSESEEEPEEPAEPEGEEEVEQEPKKKIKKKKEPEEDSFAGAEAASGPEEEPLGRMKKESFERNNKIIGEAGSNRIYKISEEEIQSIWGDPSLDGKREKAIELAKKFYAGKPSINLEINKLTAMKTPGQIDDWATQMLLHGEGLGLGTGRKKKSKKSESIEYNKEQKKNPKIVDFDSFKAARKAINLISKNKIYNSWSDNMTKEIELWFKIDGDSKEPINNMYSHEIEMLLKMKNFQTECIDKFFRLYKDIDRTYKNYKSFCKKIEKNVSEDLTGDLTTAISRMPATSKAQLSKALTQDNDNKALANQIISTLKKGGANVK